LTWLANVYVLRCCCTCATHWLQFNAGSAGGAGYLAGQAFLNTNAAAATGMLTFMLMVSQEVLVCLWALCTVPVHLVLVLFILL
jgi:ammonia channel protein AmtB